jgi:hypothetical protein
MIKKTKLGEDIEELVNRMMELDDELQSVAASQDRILSDIPQLIVMLESLFRLLSEKKLITKDEWQEKIDEVQKISDAEKAKAFIIAKELAKTNYLKWLITKSDKIGNA